MTSFDTIKKYGSQRVGPPTPVVLPPPVKQILHEQHSQSNKHTLINLAKESKRHSHIVILQRPSMFSHRGVIALSGFGTIKKLPLRLTPKREVSASNDYRSNEAIQFTIASNVRARSSRTDSLKQDFIRHHLLSMKPGVNPQRLTPGFVFVFENMQPRKLVSPVYMGGA